MNNDLISREALKEEVKTMFCPDGYKIMMLERIDNAPTVENITVFCENADEKTIEELKAELKRVITELRPQGEWYDCKKPKCLKGRKGEYVLYKIDYLLDNLAREIYLLESARRAKGGAE